jgi:hypothetical protein
MNVSKFVSAAVIVLLAGQAVLADGGAAHQVKQTAPVQMGTSGGQYNDASAAYCCGGTLGSLVLRDGVLCILSNNHVLARSGSSVTGDDTIQPGLIDSSCRSANDNIVGDFAGNIVPLGTANVDTALSIARVNMVDASGAILDIGVPCSATQAPALNMPVIKSGRTTGTTTGTITSLNTSVSIQYQKGCNSGKKFTVSYTNQIVSTAMSAGGDSGSLLLSNDGTPNPVGLLFAGSTSVTIYNPIQHVVNAYTAGGHTFSFVGNTCGGFIADPVAPAPSQQAMANALRVKVEHENALLHTPGIWGVGIGSAANNPAEAVIVVYMESPAPAAITPDAAPGAKRAVLTAPAPVALPSEFDGVKVRVIYTDPFVAQ